MPVRISTSEASLIMVSAEVAKYTPVLPAVLAHKRRQLLEGDTLRGDLLS